MTTSTSPKTWHLSEHLTDAMTRTRLGDPRQPAVWPSEASATLINEHGEPEQVGACRRAVYLRYTRDTYYFNPDAHTEHKDLVFELDVRNIEPDRYMRWIWAAGNLFEDFVIQQAKESGVWLADQVQVVIPAVGVVGKLDLMVVNPYTGGIVLEEIKSIYGHNSTSVLGSPGMHNKKQSGTPRDSNVMQIAIYDWHLRKRIDNIEMSRLFYGARDTGRFGEFNILTELNTETGLTEVKYQSVVPHVGPVVNSGITIENIISQYAYVQDHFKTGTLPPRDYDIEYSQEKIQLMYERGQLGKGDTEAHEKIQARLEENRVRVEQGLEPKRELKSIEKGSWKCGFCSFKNFCYAPDNTPRFG